MWEGAQSSINCTSEMMKLADVFIWLDDAQFSKGSFTNRIQVKIGDDRKWMTVPLDGKGAFQEIHALQARDDSWIASHRSLLQNALKSAPFKATAFEVFDRAVDRDSLCEVLIASAEEQARALGAMPGDVRIASQMSVPGNSWQRVIDMVQAVGGTHYISGAGGARYLDHSAFEAAGLTVSYMNYNPLPWPQAGDSFTPYVTSLDLIAAAGDTAGTHLRPSLMPWRERLAEINAGPDEEGS